jgi:hypothetical protein
MTGKLMYLYRSTDCNRQILVYISMHINQWNLSVTEKQGAKIFSDAGRFLGSVKVSR